MVSGYPAVLLLPPRQGRPHTSVEEGLPLLSPFGSWDLLVPPLLAMIGRCLVSLTAFCLPGKGRCASCCVKVRPIPAPAKSRTLLASGSLPCQEWLDPGSEDATRTFRFQFSSLTVGVFSVRLCPHGHRRATKSGTISCIICVRWKDFLVGEEAPLI